MPNSETQMAAEQCVIDAGAVTKCEICHSNYIRAWDDDAERQAYAIATNRWRDGEPGFRGGLPPIGDPGSRLVHGVG